MTTCSFPPILADSFGSFVLGAVNLSPGNSAGVVLLVVGLILANAIFVAAEFALVKVHISQLEDAVDENRRGSALALHVARHIEAYLSACQIGITAASLILGAVSVPFFTTLIAPWFEMLGLHQTVATIIGFALVVLLLTVVHTIFGEQIPRVFGIRKTVGTAIVCSYPLRVFYALVAAPVWLTNRIGRFLLMKVFRMEPVDNSYIAHTADELRILVEETGKGLVVTETEREIVLNALGLNELSVRDILTPRNEVIVLDVHKTFKENLEIALQSKHTRFPLVDRHLDKALGLIHIKDLLREMQKDSPNLFAVKRDLIGVSEKVPLDEMLQIFLTKRAHMALVIDEFGGSVGLVMFDDVLDQVVGEIRDEFDEEEESGFQRIDDDTFIVEGWLPLHELANLVEDLDLDDPQVSTVGGYLTSLIGHLPEVGETVMIEGFLAEVLKSDERTVQEIKFTRVEDAAVLASEELDDDERDRTSQLPPRGGKVAS